MLIDIDIDNNISKSLVQISSKIDITTHNININNLKTRLDGLIIAQISDLHINDKNIELVEQTINILNKLTPDVVAITGDIICNGKKFIPDLVRIFKQIKSNYGCFACLGNHDHSDGDDSLLIREAYKRADIRLLVNESARLNIMGEDLLIAGADDFELGNQNIVKMTRNIDKELTSVFLTHNPFNFKEFTCYNPDLVLAGHTHGGQLNFSAFNMLYRFIVGSEYIAGLYNLRESLLYVNRGIGTTLFSPNFLNKKFSISTPRINSKPEISLFRLSNKAEDKI